MTETYNLKDVKVLIANRGEIALRIFRTCKDMGLRTVAIHSEVDRNLMHVCLSDESMCIGPNDPCRSYLNILRILSVCNLKNVDLVHPGYGFLSENYVFASVLDEYSVKFIGPSSSHIQIMGDKIHARKIAKEIGLPSLPGSESTLRDIKDLKENIRKIGGYPVILKASAGGGGRAMKVIRDSEQVEQSWYQVLREAKMFFQSSDIYVEKFLDNPKHIEVQVFGDKSENYVHMGERECSVQRRSQKVIEETPSPSISQSERDYITKICVDAIKKIGYRNAGTIEFLYQDSQFYFIEMNTRIQVEHCVTEMVTGRDIVKDQILEALGEPIVADHSFNGHSIQCRINAEDPHTFKPSCGTITKLNVPLGPFVRFESAIYNGYTVPHSYDNMIAKVVVHASSREEAIRRMLRCLKEVVIEGIKTNISFLEKILTSPEFQSGSYTTATRF